MQLLVLLTNYRSVTIFLFKYQVHLMMLVNKTHIGEEYLYSIAGQYYDGKNCGLLEVELL